MKRKIVVFLLQYLLLFVSFLFVSNNFQIVFAAPARILNYQGQLKDSSNNPITTPTTIQFSIYNHPTLGAPSDTPTSSGPLLWKQLHDGVICSQVTPNSLGVFSVALGDCISFPSYLDFNQTYYIGIKIGSNPEATPRLRIGSSPMAENVRNITFDDNVSSAFRIGTTMVDYLSFNSTTGNETITIGVNTVIGTPMQQLTIGAILQGSTPLVFEGSTIDLNRLTLAVADPTGTRVITLPDNSGVVAVAVNPIGPLTLSTTGVLDCPTCLTTSTPTGGNLNYAYNFGGLGAGRIINLLSTNGNSVEIRTPYDTSSPFGINNALTIVGDGTGYNTLNSGIALLKLDSSYADASAIIFANDVNNFASINFGGLIYLSDPGNEFLQIGLNQGFSTAYSNVIFDISGLSLYAGTTSPGTGIISISADSSINAYSPSINFLSYSNILNFSGQNTSDFMGALTVFNSSSSYPQVLRLSNTHGSIQQIVGNGDPNGVFTALEGSIYFNTASTSANDVLWLKTGGFSNTNWFPVLTSSASALLWTEDTMNNFVHPTNISNSVQIGTTIPLYATLGVQGDVRFIANPFDSPFFEYVSNSRYIRLGDGGSYNSTNIDIDDIAGTINLFGGTNGGSILITGATTTSSISAGSIIVNAGNSFHPSGIGGNLSLAAGNGSNAGGNVEIYSGSTSGTSSAGYINITGGSSYSSADAGYIIISGGSNSSNGNGGYVLIESGSSFAGNPGYIRLVTTPGNGINGDISLEASMVTTSTPGQINLSTGVGSIQGYVNINNPSSVFSNTATMLRFFEGNNYGNNYVGLKAPDDLSGITTEYVLPTSDGSAGQVLTTNGLGQMYWSTITSGVSLQGAYNFGGPAAGRTITTTSATTPVRINFTDAFGDNFALELRNQARPNEGIFFGNQSFFGSATSRISFFTDVSTPTMSSYNISFDHSSNQMYQQLLKSIGGTAGEFRMADPDIANAAFRFFLPGSQTNVLQLFNNTGHGIIQYLGNGSPEGVIFANSGSIFFRQDGTGSEHLYLKTTDSSSSGWEIIATSGNTIFQGGNSFGSAMSIGTNDNFAINFKTNNINRMTLNNNGELRILNNSSLSHWGQVLTIQNTAGVHQNRIRLEGPTQIISFGQSISYPMGFNIFSENHGLEIFRIDANMFSSPSAPFAYNMMIGNANSYITRLTFAHSNHTVRAEVNNSYLWTLFKETAPSNHLMVIDLSERFGIGTTGPTHKFTVSDPSNNNVARFFGIGSNQCTVVAGTGWSCTSDSRAKKNILNIENATNVIMSLRPVTYNWNWISSDDTLQYGFIAQEVESVLPDIVLTDPDGLKSMNVTALIPFLVKSQQEQISRIQSLEDSVLSINTLNSIDPNIINSINSSIESIQGSVSSLSSQITNLNSRIDEIESTLSLLSNISIDFNNLNLQSFTLSNLSIQNTLNINGSLIITSNIKVSDQIAGKKTISAGQTEVLVQFQSVYSNIPVVFVTPIGDVFLQENIIYTVSNVTQLGFKIKINSPATQDLEFSWIALDKI